MSPSRCWWCSCRVLLVEFLPENCPWLKEAASPRLNPLAWAACNLWQDNSVYQVYQFDPLRRDILASELPVDSPEAFVKTAVWLKFSVLCPSLPRALPTHFVHVNSSKSVPGGPDLCQPGTVLRIFHAFCLLTLRTTFWDKHCCCRAHFTMKAKTGEVACSRSHKASKCTTELQAQGLLWSLLLSWLTTSPHTQTLEALANLQQLLLYLQASQLISTSFPHQKLLLTF